MAVMPIPVLADNIDSRQTEKDTTISDFSGLNAILGGLGVKNEYLDVQNETGLKTQIQDFLTKSCEGDVILEEIAYQIIDKESGFQNIPNFLYTNESGKYTAYGIFMFLKSTWINECGNNPLDRMNIEKNIQCGVKMLKDGKFSHWNESKWGKNGWYNKLSEKAKQRINFQQPKIKIVNFLNGLVTIDKKGNILKKNGNIWYNNIEEIIPFI